MPRTPKKHDDPTARTHGVTVLFTKDERAIVARVSRAHGISAGAAIRLMMLKGAPAYDPNHPDPNPDD